MDDFEQLLKSTIDERSRNLEAKQFTRQARRRIAARRAMAVVGSLAIVSVAIAGAALGVTHLTGRDKGVPPSTEQSLTCSPQDTPGKESRFTIEWTTDAYVIGQGQFKGEPWILCGARANTGTDDDVRPAFCTDWALGFGGRGGWVCSSSILKYEDSADYFLRASDSFAGPVGAYYGAISERVARVELHTHDGAVIAGRILATPPAVDVPFGFFVAFTEQPNVGVVVKVLDEEGNVLERERFAHLPTLTVNKIGSGAGTVTGYSTQMLDASKQGDVPHQQNKKWIDCGERCSVTLEKGADVTLVARPESGSAFVGWQGPCFLADDGCRLILKEDVTITARFNDST